MQQKLPTNWFELALYLVTTKHGARLLGFLIVAIAAILLLSIQLIRPDKLEITTNAGTISIIKGSTQNAVLMLSAAGSREHNLPWIGTGIMVKKGKKVKIEASGLVHTALDKLIAVAQTDRRIEPAWVDPNGSRREEERDWDDKRKKYKLMPDKEGAHYGYGMLLAAVRNDQNQVQDKVAVGKKYEFDAKTNGELVLAVNDLLLDGDARNIYALPLENNYSYYKNKVEEEDNLRKENTDSNKTLNEKVKEEYQKRLKAWEDIAKNNNWMVWYDDNIGAFSVSVTVN